ncbi:MAG: flagellar motor switch protein FliN [Nitrospinae bacterium]|nr:flagellar motor switch protein FliN [Nitrospinota bacterium]
MPSRYLQLFHEEDKLKMAENKDISVNKEGKADIGKKEATTDAKDIKNLDLILDIPLKVTVELGRTRMLINDLLQLGQGSVIELNKLAGEPLEVLVNYKLIARGEVVVVNEKFGVRLTDIIAPIERIEQLK